MLSLPESICWPAMKTAPSATMIPEAMDAEVMNFIFLNEVSMVSKYFMILSICIVFDCSYDAFTARLAMLEMNP